MGKMHLSKARLRRMHDVMIGHIDRGTLPGLVALVALRDQVHVEAIGTLAVGGRAPMERDTLFRIASITKPITAVATMILIEECQLRLDDPVDDLLPELASRRVLSRVDGPLDDTSPAHRSITVRDLLTFRLGIGSIMMPPGTCPIQVAMHEHGIGGDGPPRPAEVAEPDEWMRRLGSLPLVHQPGERWMYNVGSDVLGVLVARASGQSFESFLRERIFEPLGMKDTGFYVPVGEIHRLATSYAPHPETGTPELYDPAEGGQWSRPPAFASGAGGLVSTVDDVLAFAEMLLHEGDGGDTRILSRASMRTMTTDQITSEQKARSRADVCDFDRFGWGFGMSIVTRRDDLANRGQFGWDGGMGTSWASDPSEGLTGVLLTQCNWTAPRQPPVCRDFWTCAHQAVED